MADQWYYQRLGEDHGPCTSQQMKELIAAGKIKSDTMVKRGKLDKWEPARRVIGSKSKRRSPKPADKDSSKQADNEIEKKEARKQERQKQEALKKSEPEQWYYRRLGADMGPCSTVEIQDLIASGKINGGTMVKRGKHEKWETADRTPGLTVKRRADKPTDEVVPKKNDGQWYYQRLGEDLGPRTTEQMEDLVAAGTINGDTMVKNGKLEKWVRAHSIIGLTDKDRSPKPTDKVAQKKRMLKAAMIAVDKLETTSGFADSYADIENAYSYGSKLVFFGGAVFPRTCIWTNEPVTRMRRITVVEHVHTGNSVEILSASVRLPVGDSHVNQHRNTAAKWSDISQRFADKLKIISLLVLFFLAANLCYSFGFTNEAERSKFEQRREMWARTEKNLETKYGPDWESQPGIAKLDLGTLPWIRFEISAIGILLSLMAYGSAFGIARFEGITKSQNPLEAPGKFRNDGSILIHGVHKEFLVQLPAMPKELR